MIFGRRQRSRPEPEDASTAAADAVRDFAAPAGPSDPPWGSDPTPNGPAAGNAAADGFRFTVQDTFTITGRGTVVTGVVESGSIRVGDVVTIAGRDGVRSARIGGIEAFRKRIQEAASGESVGLLLRDVGSADVSAGDVVTA